MIILHKSLNVIALTQYKITRILYPEMQSIGLMQTNPIDLFRKIVVYVLDLHWTVTDMPLDLTHPLFHFLHFKGWPTRLAKMRPQDPAFDFHDNATNFSFFWFMRIAFSPQGGALRFSVLAKAFGACSLNPCILGSQS